MHLANWTKISFIHLHCANDSNVSVACVCVHVLRGGWLSDSGGCWRTRVGSVKKHGEIPHSKNNGALHALEQAMEGWTAGRHQLRGGHGGHSKVEHGYGRDKVD